MHELLFSLWNILKDTGIFLMAGVLAAGFLRPLIHFFKQFAGKNISCKRDRPLFNSWSSHTTMFVQRAALCPEYTSSGRKPGSKPCLSYLSSRRLALIQFW